MAKQKILFVYYTMMLGGSTTSLLSLLNSIDYEKYDVDLLLYRNEGPFMPYIPKEVNLLPQAYIPHSNVKKVVKTLANGTLIRAYYHGLKYYHKLKPTSQSMAYAQLSFCRKITEKYDVAIGFMELWSDVFVNLKVNAKKKISWIHVDYEKAHYIPKIDTKMLNKADYVVCVSKECLDNFKRSFPTLDKKCVYIPNILTKKFLESRANEVIDFELERKDALNIVSVCRLAIDHKGLDRGIEAIAYLNKNGANINWYIIGEGSDRTNVESLIKKNNMENHIHLLGQKVNPYPYLKKFDAFFLPSRFEGKPIAITESQMLELPVLVTDYASAKEQVDPYIDGFVCENNFDGIVKMLEFYSKNRDYLLRMKQKMISKNYDNDKEIEQIYELFKSKGF